MFESWLKQEQAVIKSRFKGARIICIVIAIMMVPSIFSSVFLMMYSGGVGTFFVIIFSVLVIVVVLSMGDYKKRFVKPLLASIQQELPTEEARQEFAQQMLTQAVCIAYQPLPQVKSCDMMVAKDYCYMRQPKKSRIINNNQIRRLVLTKENYYVGNRGHMRWCFALALYSSDDEKPIWKGYFMNNDAVSQAFVQFKAILPSQVAVQDLVSNPVEKPKKPLWKSLLEWIPVLLFLALMIYLAKFLNK